MRPLQKAVSFLSGLFTFVGCSCLLTSQSTAQVGPKRQVAVTAEATSDSKGAKPWRYLLHLPNGYDSSAKGEKWPLLFYLHGRSVRGNDLTKIKRYGPPSFVDRMEHVPYVTVSPQLPDGAWPAEQLNMLLEEVLDNYRIDSDRVYLTGVSLGAMGAWTLASAYPDRFAAFVPICAHGPTSAAERLTKMPIWAFHGAKDKLVPIDPHRELIEAIRENGGNARLTVYPEGDHGSVIGPTYQNDEMWEWLLKQRRKPQPDKSTH